MSPYLKVRKFKLQISIIIYILLQCLHTNIKSYELPVVFNIIEIENSQYNIEPGKVLDVSEKSFIVKTMDNSIEIISHDFELLPNKGEYL